MNYKLEWIASVKDHMAGGIQSVKQKIGGLEKFSGQADRRIGGNLKRTQGSLLKFSGKNVEMFSQLSSQIPALGEGVAMLANPYAAAATAAVVAVTAIAKGLHAATMAASEYNREFSKIANLNLDKTRSQIAELKKEVLNTTFDSGKNTAQITQAYYDVQSITGKYGAEVDKIIKKTGRFSTAVGSEFNQQVTSAATAMDIFKLRADQLDSVLTSSAKTVQVGKVNFEELARVQVDYLGPAAAANQTIDEANKLFAVFSKRTKSAEEGATLTKGALQDLFKARSLEAFKTLKVDVFDAKGQAKDLTTIITDLNKVLAGADDRQISKVVELFGGNEGLQALVRETATNGRQLLGTFKQFEEVKFDTNEAYKNAKNDISSLWQEMKNKLNVVMIELGQDLLPDVVKIMKILNKNFWIFRAAIKFAWKTNSFILWIRYTLRMVRLGYQAIDSLVERIQKLVGMQPGGEGFRRWMNERKKDFNYLMSILKELTKVQLGVMSFDPKMVASSTLRVMSLLKDGPDKYDPLKDKKRHFKRKSRSELGLTPEGGNKTLDGLLGDDDITKKKRRSEVEAVASGNSSNRHISIKIGKLVESLNFHEVKNIADIRGTVRRVIQEEMMRAIYDVEAQYMTN